LLCVLCRKPGSNVTTCACIVSKVLRNVFFHTMERFRETWTIPSRDHYMYVPLMSVGKIGYLTWLSHNASNSPDWSYICIRTERVLTRYRTTLRSDPQKYRCRATSTCSSVSMDIVSQLQVFVVDPSHMILRRTRSQWCVYPAASKGYDITEGGPERVFAWHSCSNLIEHRCQDREYVVTAKPGVLEASLRTLTTPDKHSKSRYIDLYCSSFCQDMRQGTCQGCQVGGHEHCELFYLIESRVD